ncbi:MAG: hypothetical protein GY834_03910 [Bacteroidetes bacterium]|nr:hypothetical protein [Bacteroidota bacterium]
METKAKKKRRIKGKKWVKEYKGNNILHAYKRKFKIPLISAINDLESIGVPLNEAEVAQIKIDRHYNGQQQINQNDLAELNSIIRNATVGDF